jgi:hypothetical protein
VPHFDMKPVGRSHLPTSKDVKAHHRSRGNDEAGRSFDYRREGAKVRLAVGIFLWTGQRRGDARIFGLRHTQLGKSNFKAAKTDVDLWLPMAIARRMAATAATQQQIKAVAGWNGDAEAAIYVADAEQVKLADDTMAAIVQRFSDNPGVVILSNRVIPALSNPQKRLTFAAFCTDW